ncbi:MAG: hypothetical protein ACPG6V_02680 [Flavobacteriales bacterium]
MLNYKWVVILVVLLKIITVSFVFQSQNNFQEAEKVAVSIAKGMSDVRDIKVWALPEKFHVDHKPINKLHFKSDDWQSFNTVSNVINATALDGGNGIFYYFTLHYWTKFFGLQGKSLFGFHLLFVFLALTYSYKIARLFTENNMFIGLFMLLMCFNPLNQYQEFNLRSYNLVIVFVIIQLYYFIKQFKNPQLQNRKDLFLFTIISICLVFSHFLTLAITGLMFLALLLIHLKNKRKIVEIISLGALVLVPFVIWYVYVSKTAGGQGAMYETYELINVNLPNNNFFFNRPSIKDYIFSIPQNTLYFLGIGLQDFDQFRFRDFFIYFLPFVLAIFYAFKSKGEKRILGLLLGFYVITQFFMLAIAGINNSSSSLKVIYQIPFYPILVLFLFLIILAIKNDKKWLSKIIMIVPVVSIIGFIFLRNDFGSKKVTDDTEQELNELIQDVTRNLQENDTVIYSNWDDAHFANLFIENNTFYQRVDKNIRIENSFIVKRKNNKESIYHYKKSPKSYQNMIDAEWIKSIRNNKD